MRGAADGNLPGEGCRVAAFEGLDILAVDETIVASLTVVDVCLELAGLTIVSCFAGDEGFTKPFVFICGTFCISSADEGREPTLHGVKGRGSALVGVKKADCRRPLAGDCGNNDKLWRVRSDREGRCLRKEAFSERACDGCNS